MTKLENLYLGSSTKITDIKPILELQSLKTLEMENFKSVKDFTILSEKTELIGLGINGGMYSTLKLKTLEYLKNLVNLEYLQLINTQILDKSIEPICKLKKLKTLRLTNYWSEAEFELLRNNIPNLRFGNVVPDEKTKRLMKIFGK